ncbi:hypothetical protein JCM10213_006685 [Rhodosporidiobolus nylandii]
MPPGRLFHPATVPDLSLLPHLCSLTVLLTAPPAGSLALYLSDHTTLQAFNEAQLRNLQDLLAGSGTLTGATAFNVVLDLEASTDCSGEARRRILCAWASKLYVSPFKEFLQRPGWERVKTLDATALGLWRLERE